MKKYVLLVAAMVVGTVSASAQFFVGGSLDYHSDATDKSTLNFVPKIGYVISDKLEVGAYIDYKSVTKPKEDDSNSGSGSWGTGSSSGSDEGTIDFGSVDDLPGTGFGAFGRYKFLEVDKLSLWGQASLGMKSPEGLSILSLKAVPVVKYAWSNKINLTSAVNLLSFSYKSISATGGGSGVSDITLGAGETSSIAIGIEYKF